jgi:hypothetical protein
MEENSLGARCGGGRCYNDGDFESGSVPGSIHMGNVGSNGLQFDIVDPSSGTGRVRTRNVNPRGSGSGGSGVELAIDLASSGQFQFNLPIPTRYIALLFGAYDPSGAIVVNGVSTPLAGNFAALDGSILGGVLVSVIPSPSPPFGIPNRQGELLLNGEINSFALRGTELRIDNVRIAVPEPSTAILFWSACMFCFWRSRRWFYRRGKENIFTLLQNGKRRARQAKFQSFLLMPRSFRTPRRFKAAAKFAAPSNRFNR